VSWAIRAEEWVTKAEGPLLDLAASVADGAPVDWPAAESAAAGVDQRLIRHLRLVAEVAELYRSLPNPPQAPPEEPLPEGPRWGRLVLLEKIGEGTSSEVYRAWDPELQREVALKLLRAEGSEAEAARWRMLGEGRRLARVRHAHVVLVFGADRREDRVGIWMEHVDGATLDEIVRRSGLFGPHEASLIGLDLCRALAAVHAAGLAHRDVKAQNVMRETGGRIVLMDFGTGEEFKPSGAAPRLAGTPLYLAPEVLAGGTATASSDLYALGVLLFYLVTGQFPVAAATFDDLVAAHARGDVRRLRDLRPNLPDAFVRVVERALAPTPAARYSSAGAMETALRQCIAATGPTPQVPADRQVARTWWTGAASLAVGALIALLAILMPAWRGSAPAGTGAIDQLAVMPLVDKSGGLTPPYLADALTAELIGALGQIRSLRITSDASVLRLRSTATPVGDVARFLGVDAVLEGSISRRFGSAVGAGPAVTVNARLLAAGTGQALWTGTFHGRSGDIAVLAAEVASAVARQIRVAVTRDESRRLRAGRQTSPDAEEAYFRGRAHLRQLGIAGSRLAVAELERAVRLDPSYAQAYAALARTYMTLGFAGGLSQPEARQKALGPAVRALELNDTLAEGHEVMADLRFFYDWDWKAAEAGYRRALEIHPSSQYGRSQYARYLAAAARVPEALAEATRALELDPLSAEAALTLALIQYYARDYSKAQQSLDKALSLDPGQARIHALRARVLEAESRLREAIAANERALTLVPEPAASWFAHRARLEALAGNIPEARSRLTRLIADEASGARRLAPEHVAYVHLALDDPEAAIRLITRAVDERDPGILWLAVDPRLDPLRADPRFDTLLGRVHGR
jgi:TolB-like protein/tetratricopeptide (TPR) repeat protein/tRNA A-37 threonylcarbamoyl transferase component Bud32